MSLEQCANCKCDSTPWHWNKYLQGHVCQNCMSLTFEGIPYNHKYQWEHEVCTGWDSVENGRFRIWKENLFRKDKDGEICAWRLKCFNDLAAYDVDRYRETLMDHEWVFKEDRPPILHTTNRSDIRLLFVRRFDFCWTEPLIKVQTPYL